MKKIIAFIMVAAMCLSFAACGGGDNGTDVSETTNSADSKISKEEMLASAEAVKIEDIEQETMSNLAKAKQSFCNKTLLLSGTVGEIKEDYAEIKSGTCVVDVYLSQTHQ